MTRVLGPSDSWYDPPEPPLPCCAEAEDGDPDHDSEACLAEQAEARAATRSSAAEWER